MKARLTALASATLLALAALMPGSTAASAAPQPPAVRSTTASAAAKLHKLPWRIDTTRTGIMRGGSPTPYVKLTFDDDGSAAATRRILDTLDRYKVKGIFYRNAKKSSVNDMIVRRGHVLASHTSPHTAMPTNCAAALKRVQAGATPNSTPKLVRFPGGTNSFNVALVKCLAKRGWQVSYWNVDTNDWRGRSAAQITNAVLKGDKMTPPARAGSNVLMHSRGNTPAALPDIIKGLQKKGLKILPQ